MGLLCDCTTSPINRLQLYFTRLTLCSSLWSWPREVMEGDFTIPALVLVLVYGHCILYMAGVRSWPRWHGSCLVTCVITVAQLPSTHPPPPASVHYTAVGDSFHDCSFNFVLKMDFLEVYLMDWCIFTLKIKSKSGSIWATSNNLTFLLVSKKSHGYKGNTHRIIPTSNNIV